MFSTWKSDTSVFDSLSRPADPSPINTIPMRPATAAAVMPPPTKEGHSIINEWLKMRGDLEGDGDILVKGEIYGNIRCKLLIIEIGALVEGGIEAEDVVIRGTARGTIRTTRIRLEKTALVDAEIYHESFSAEEGARVKGMMHAHDQGARAKAVVPQPATREADTHVAKTTYRPVQAPAAKPETPEAKVSSALYQMLDVARTNGRTAA